VLLAFKQPEKVDALAIEDPKDRAKFDIPSWLKRHFPLRAPELVAGRFTMNIHRCVQTTAASLL